MTGADGSTDIARVSVARRLAMRDDSRSHGVERVAPRDRAREIDLRRSSGRRRVLESHEARRDPRLTCCASLTRRSLASRSARSSAAD